MAFIAHIAIFNSAIIHRSGWIHVLQYRYDPFDILQYFTADFKNLYFIRRPGRRGTPYNNYQPSVDIWFKVIHINSFFSFTLCFSSVHLREVGHHIYLLN